MSCVLPLHAVLAPCPSGTAARLHAGVRCAASSDARAAARCAALGLALGLALVVAFVPRTSGAQATVPTTHSIRHTVRADVGTVTHAAFLSHQRLTAEQLDLLPSSGNPAQAHRGWISTVDVRSNVSGVLLLEPRTMAPDAAVWRVLRADGQLVPWTSQAISVSLPVSPGRHTLSFIWVAPDDTASPPDATLRIQPLL